MRADRNRHRRLFLSPASQRQPDACLRTLCAGRTEGARSPGRARFTTAHEPSPCGPTPPARPHSVSSHTAAGGCRVFGPAQGDQGVRPQVGEGPALRAASNSPEPWGHAVSLRPGAVCAVPAEPGPPYSITGRPTCPASGHRPGAFFSSTTAAPGQDGPFAVAQGGVAKRHAGAYFGAGVRTRLA